MASIVFDLNPPIETPQTLHTIDRGAPNSSVIPLPVTTTTCPFTIGWTGQDDQGGSGIARYDVYVSVDQGPFGLWLTTSETSAILNGHAGRSYAFYTVATDHVGNVEPAPAAPDAITTVRLIQLGDLDGDGDIDLDDAAGFADCMAGPLVPPTPTRLRVTRQQCLDAFNFDGDYDVDLRDFGSFQETFASP